MNTELLILLNYNIGKVQTYHLRDYFSFLLQFIFQYFVTLLSNVVSRGLLRIVSLLRCTRDIKPRLWGLKVVDTSLRSEIQLLWARAATEKNFMRSSINSKLRLPSPGRIELLKFSPFKYPPLGPKLRSNALTKSICLKKENSTTGTFHSSTNL